MSLIYNFICFVFKNLNVNELLYFQKNKFVIFLSDLEDNTVCSNTSVLASDEVVTYWACRRVSRSLFIVTSFSVDRAWRIKLFWFQKVEVIFKVKIQNYRSILLYLNVGDTFSSLRFMHLRVDKSNVPSSLHFKYRASGCL